MYKKNTEKLYGTEYRRKYSTNENITEYRDFLWFFNFQFFYSVSQRTGFYLK